MAVVIRQGLEDRDAVMGVYDPCPVVLYENNLGAFYNYEFILIIDRRVGASWERVTTLRVYPNEQTCGVFDMSGVLRYALTLGEPPTGPISYTDNPCAFLNNAEFFRVQAGQESSATPTGAITQTIAHTKYIGAVAARYLDEWTSWNDTPLPTFVMDGDGQWLTLRKKRFVKVAGQTRQVYVIPIDVNQRFSMSYLSTDTGSGWATDDMKLYVAAVTPSATLVSASVDVVNQSVDIGSFNAMDLSDGGLTREVWIGYPDIDDAVWAANIPDNTLANLYIDLRRQTDNAQRGVAILLQVRPCTNNGITFRFMNEYGGYDYLFCTGHATQTTEYTREEVNTSTGNWYTADGLTNDTNLLLNDPKKRRGKSFVTDERKAMTAHTGYLTDDDNDLVMGLLRSRLVLATRFYSNSDKVVTNEFYPVRITNSSMKSMYQDTDKLIEYTIEFEYANQPRPMS